MVWVFFPRKQVVDPLKVNFRILDQTRSHELFDMINRKQLI